MLRSLATVLLLSASSAYADNLPTLEKKLVDNNPGLQSLQSEAKAKESESAAATGTFLPNVSVIGGYEDKNTVVEPEQGYVGYINGSWNLFQGGQDFYRKDIANQESNIASLDLEIERRSLTYKLQSLYYQIQANKKILKIYDSKLQLLQSQRQMAHKKVNAGLTSGVDAIEIDIEENTLRSQQELLTSEIQQSLSDLSSLLNSPVTADQVDVTENMPASFALNIEDSLQNAPVIRRQILIENKSESARSEQRSSFIPRLDFDASYGRITAAYDDPWAGNESRVGLLLRWNLFNGLSDYNNQKAANSRATSASQQKQNTALNLKAQLENLQTRQKELQKLRGLQQERLNLTKKYYEMTLAEYKRGVKNSADLDGATTSYYENQRRVVELDRDIAIVISKIRELI